MSVPALAWSSPQPHGAYAPVSTSEPCDAQWASGSQTTGVGETLAGSAGSAQAPSSPFQPSLLLTCGCLGGLCGDSNFAATSLPLAGPFTMLIPASQTWG